MEPCKHRSTLERDGCCQPQARRGLLKRSRCLPKVPDCTWSFLSSKLPLDISADALCCARAPDHDRGCFGTHGKGWRLPGHWQEGDELARGSSPALWELGSLLTFTRDDFTFGCSTQNQDTTTCKAKLCMSPSQTYKICPAKMCPSITWQSRRGLSKLCASRDELIPLGNHAPHGTRGFLRSLATQAIAGFSDPVAPSGTGRSDGEGLRGTRDTASREGAVPASLRGAGGRGQWRNPIWQSL